MRVRIPDQIDNDNDNDNDKPNLRQQQYFEKVSSTEIEDENKKIPKSIKDLKFCGKFRIVRFLCLEFWVNSWMPFVNLILVLGFSIISWIMNYPFLDTKWKIIHPLFTFIYVLIIYKGALSNPGVVFGSEDDFSGDVLMIDTESEVQSSENRSEGKILLF